MNLETLSQLDFKAINIAERYAAIEVSHEDFGITNAFSELASGFNKLFRDTSVNTFTLRGANVSELEYEDYCYLEIPLPVGIKTSHFENRIKTIVEIARLVKTHEPALIEAFEIVKEVLENQEVMDKMMDISDNIKRFSDNVQTKLESIIDPKSKTQVVKIKEIAEDHKEFMGVLDTMSLVHFEAKDFKDVGYLSYELDDAIEQFKDDVKNHKVVTSELFIENLQETIGVLAKATTSIFKIRALAKIINDVKIEIFKKLDNLEKTKVSTESTANMIDATVVSKFRSSSLQRLLGIEVEQNEITVKDFVKLANSAYEFINGVEISSRDYHKRLTLHDEDGYKRAISMLESKYINYTENSTRLHINQFDILCKELHKDLLNGKVKNKAVEELPQKETGSRRLIIDEFGFKTMVSLNRDELGPLSETLFELNNLSDQFKSSIDNIVVERVPLKDKPEYLDMYDLVLKIRLAHFIYHAYIKPVDTLTVEIGYLLDRFN